MSTGKLFQSVIVLGQKLNLYASHVARSGINVVDGSGGSVGVAGAGYRSEQKFVQHA